MLSILLELLEQTYFNNNKIIIYRSEPFDYLSIVEMIFIVIRFSNFYLQPIETSKYSIINCIK